MIVPPHWCGKGSAGPPPTSSPEHHTLARTRRHSHETQAHRGGRADRRAVRRVRDDGGDGAGTGRQSRGRRLRDEDPGAGSAAAPGQRHLGRWSAIGSTSGPPAASRSPCSTRGPGTSSTVSSILGPRDDVTIGPDGSLYWTDIFEGEGRAARARRHRSPGSSSRMRVNPLTFSPLTGASSSPKRSSPTARRSYELDPGARGSARRPVWNPGDPFPQQLNGFDFGPDGMLYAPQPYLGRVVRLNLDATPIVPQVIADGVVVPDGGQVRFSWAAVRRDLGR